MTKIVVAFLEDKIIIYLTLLSLTSENIYIVLE